MNYYDEIKKELINNEVYKKVKDYSKNKNDLKSYYNVGKMLADAGKHYGDGILKEYSKKLTVELGKKYSITSLKYMRIFYEFSKSHSLSDQLTYTHYKILLTLKNKDEINYYMKVSVENNLSVRQLSYKIKSKEYERLDKKTKLKLISEENLEIDDFVKNPIIIKNSNNYEVINEKILKQLILEDLENFMRELGNGFSFIGSEYKIKIGDSYNYIDLLLFNYIYNCFIVVELKATELRKEHIGQIEVYMNYVDRNVKNMYQDKTIGIIIAKKENKFVLEYCSDDRIFATTYDFF